MLLFWIQCWLLLLVTLAIGGPAAASLLGEGGSLHAVGRGESVHQVVPPGAPWRTAAGLALEIRVAVRRGSL